MPQDYKIDSESRSMNKPENVTFLNATEELIRLTKRVSWEYDTSKNSRRWHQTVFYKLLNTPAKHAYILYCHNPENKPKRRNAAHQTMLLGGNNRTSMYRDFRSEIKILPVSTIRNAFTDEDRCEEVKNIDA